MIEMLCNKIFKTPVYLNWSYQFKLTTTELFLTPLFYIYIFFSHDRNPGSQPRYSLLTECKEEKNLDLQLNKPVDLLTLVLIALP